MNWSIFWTIKYMNGSIFSKARYMNGVGFEILAGTPVPQLRPLIPAPPPPHSLPRAEKIDSMESLNTFFSWQGSFIMYDWH